ncbi:MAG: hypothetical protein C6I00_00575 [Nitratiruptor sp.]|nr:hypothetical protein [Nitratiruptor sp.]NPA83360.1 GGDEF domain-containing protein [Campylobacterota bacterium]
MIGVYIKYLTIYLLIVWFSFLIQVYIIFDPMPIRPIYYVVPSVLAALLAFIPTILEVRLRRLKEEHDREIQRRSVVVKPKLRVSEGKRDKLTGAINKDAFNEIIGVKIMEAKHMDQPLSMIIFDIDFFKKINDTYGHMVGDKILKEVAEVVRSNIRKSEYFVRWGGEEFIILLPGTSLKGAQMVAEKLRRVIETHQFPEVNRVTCSFGVTQLLQEDTIATFLERADEALYEAKREGRNRVKVRL